VWRRLPPYYGHSSFVVLVFAYARAAVVEPPLVICPAIVTVLTLRTLSPLANPDTQPQLYLVLAFELAMLIGLWTSLLGILRLGFVVDLLGAPVLSGFITAAGLVIASTQPRSFFSTNAPRTTNFIPSMIEWARSLPTTNWPTFVLATTCFLVLIAIHMINDDMPIYSRGNRYPVQGALSVTVFPTLACWAGKFGAVRHQAGGPGSGRTVRAVVSQL
jgi:MFS superfamily sulfate permease-like transporter